MLLPNWKRHLIRMHTGRYRVVGHLALPPGAATAEYLNREGPFTPLEDAVLYPASYRRVEPDEKETLRVPLLAVNKSDVLWLEGGNPGTAKATPALLTRRSLVVLFSDHVLAGEVEVLKTVDLVAYLEHAGPFLTLLEPGLYSLAEFADGAPPAERFAFLTVNLRQVLGFLVHEEMAHWKGLY